MMRRKKQEEFPKLLIEGKKESRDANENYEGSTDIISDEISRTSSRDFFELSPEEIADFKPPEPVSVEAMSAISVKVRKKKLLNAVIGLSFLIIIAAILAAFLWPSSSSKVPDFSGLMLSVAMEKGRSSGFKPKVINWEYSNKHPYGVVLSQEPHSGKVVSKGIEINLTVSKGQEPELPISSIHVSSDSGGEVSQGSVIGKVICIDPGHQLVAPQDEWVDPGMTKRNAGEPGVRGISTGNAEYLLTLDVAMKLNTLLEKDGIKVVLTRDTGEVDLSNIARAEIAANNDADLLVSIHFNYTDDPSENGTATIYPSKNSWTEAIYERSKTAALYIQKELSKSCETKDIGVFQNNEMTLFNWSSVPVVQVLPVYLSNAKEDEELALDQFRWKVAWGLRNGIEDYLRSL
ncbi:MAG: N-acetylmuramoyl-L-alanine amidase [Actinomycetota bacterium]|nr:N-acetylmuramoyl-L-alanine amidase [Actinomycetota bacterium]